MPSLKSRIVITEKCNGKCWYCYTKKSKKDMSEDLYICIINKLKDIYKKNNFSRIKIGLSGGDPFYSDFILKAKKITENILGNDLSVFYTSFCNQSNIEIAKKFCEDGGLILVSLNEDPLDEIIEKSLSLKNIVSFNVIMTEYNLNRIDEIIDNVIKYDLPLRLNTLCNCKNEIGNEKLSYYFKIIMKKLQESNFRIRRSVPFFSCLNERNKVSHYCGYGQHYYHFDIDGNLSRCQAEDPITNIFDPEMEEKFYLKNVFHEECINCSVFHLCRGGCFYSNKNKEYCSFYKTVCEEMKKYRNIGKNICINKIGV